MKNTPWTIEERLTCRAVVDSARNDILHVDKEPSGSVTSRGFTSEELADRIRLLAAAPKLVEALNRSLQGLLAAFPHADRIRDILAPIISETQAAIQLATPQFCIGDQVQNIEDKWQGAVIGFEWINGDEMLVCQYRHQDGSLAADDKRWFAPADMRLVRRP